MASHFRSVSRLVLLLPLFCCLAVLTSLTLPAPQLFAQQQAQRVVQGKIFNSSGVGLKGATVFLKDDRTLAVKSYIAADDGYFRFVQLMQNTDYELWAEYDGKKSAVKSISSFDTRAEINLTLKIDTK
ncbi:MAG: carboxypeptidase-like regulatory domain-containing protein [Acidobacteriaceae bacterium]